MRTLDCFAALAMTIFLLVSTPAHAMTGKAAQVVRQLEQKPPPVFHVPTMAKRTLANGMRCYFLEDHALPLVRLRILLPAGSVFDPADTVGLNGMMLGLLRSGGTKAHAATAVDDGLDQQSIQIGFDPGMEVSSANMSAMKEVATAGLSWLMEMLFTPSFEPARVDVVKGAVKEGLRRQNDSPAGIVQREFRKVVYGTTSPWARTPTEGMIDAMRVPDLQIAHAAMLAPKEWICAAAGDLTPDAFAAALDRAMAPYASIAQTGARRPAPPEPPVFRGATYLAAKDAAQSAITMGHRGGDRFSPDKYPLIVMNEILGSGHTFTSWLTSTIRTEKGLAYEVWSAYGFGPSDAPGIFQIHAKTRPEKSAEVVQLARAAVAKLHAAKAIGARDVQVMKESILKRSIFDYEEPFNIAAETARFVYFGLPENYIEQYHQAIARVSLADVRRVARRYLHPDAVQILIVGDPKKMSLWLRSTAPMKRYP